MAPVGTPIHLYASASLAANSQGGVNTQALVNPYGSPMEIHEIKFAISAFGTTDIGSFPDTGALLGVKLDMGALEITNGFVPVWALGADVNSQSVNVINYSVNSVTKYYQTNYYSWRFAKPLYVPIGSVLTPSFQNRGFIPQDVTVGIGYSGRSLPMNTPPPAEVWLPWAAGHYAKTFTLATTGSDFDLSPETAIFNKHNSAIRLQRFGIRCPVIATDGAWSEIGDNVGIIGKALQAKITSSDGFPIVRQYTPLSNIVNAWTRSWEMSGAQMAPNSYWSIMTKMAQSLSSTLLAQPQYALVGSRRV